MARIALVSSSVRANSRSREGILLAERQLRGLGAETDLLDLVELDLPPYPRGEHDASLLSVVEGFNATDGWVLGTPVYNFGVSGTLMTFLHYALAHDTGREWRPFVVVASIGGLRSAMAPDTLIRSVMNERRSVAVGPPVMVHGDNVGLESRIGEAMRALLVFAVASQTIA